MPKTVLIKNAIISPTSAAFKTGGQSGEPLKVQLEFFPISGQQVVDLLELRGKELVVCIAPVTASSEEIASELSAARSNGKHS